jgi:hypothetical protein
MFSRLYDDVLDDFPTREDQFGMPGRLLDSCPYFGLVRVESERLCCFDISRENAVLLISGT